MEIKVSLILASIFAYSCFNDVLGMETEPVESIHPLSPYDPTLNGDKITEGEYDSLCNDGVGSAGRTRSGCPEFAAFKIHFTEPEDEYLEFNMLKCPTTSSPVYVLKSGGNKKAFFVGSRPPVLTKRTAEEGSSGSKRRSPK